MGYCKKCGSEMPDNTRFCGNCGAKMLRPSSNKSGSRRKRKKSFYKKRILLIIGVLLLVLIEIAAIYFVVEYQKTKEKGTEEAESVLEELENTINYFWILEPTIEADDIFYPVEYNTNSVNEGFLQSESSRAVIQKDNALGVIDMNGDMLTEFIYEDIDAYGDNYIMTRIQNADGEEDTIDQLDESGAVTVCQEMPISNSIYYYSCSNKLYSIDDVINFSETRKPEGLIPISKSSKVFTLENAAEWWEKLEKYALCKNGVLVTNFIYDECGSFSEGLATVCKDGKWGYIDEEGKVIIPIEFDPSWSQFERTIETYDGSNEARDFCYAVSEGYVTLCKEGEWELRNFTGEVMIPPGVFEKILPVYEEKCWVKQDGKWGVIQLKEE